MKALQFVIAALAFSLFATMALAQPFVPAEVKTVLWAKEVAIYAGRGHGDLGPYLSNASPEFAAWPPQAKAPITLEQLRASAPSMANSKEQLELTFTSIALSGNTAILYYRTHMLVEPSGAPTELYYNVTHTWVYESGAWRLLGGMARLAQKPG